MNIRSSITAVACVTASTFTVGGVFAHAAEPYDAAGDHAADIQPTVDDFRAAIGGGTVAGPNGSFGAARREINWDGVSDTFAPQAANDLSGNVSRKLLQPELTTRCCLFNTRNWVSSQYGRRQPSRS